MIRRMMMAGLKNFSGDPNLLPNMSFLILSLDYFTSTDNKIWIQKTISGSKAPIGYVMGSDSCVLIKFIDDGYAVAPELDTLDDGDIGLWFWRDGNVFKYESIEDGIQSITPVVNRYYGWLREGDNVKLVSTDDGVSFITIFDFGSRPTAVYLKHELSSSAQQNKWYYPQGRGLTLA